ncbi:MAG: hypothetical protein ACXVKK_10470 [Flavisolibacter sp.]
MYLFCTVFPPSRSQNRTEQTMGLSDNDIWQYANTSKGEPKGLYVRTGARGMYTWNVYLELADTDEPARFIGTIQADTMAEALEKAALAFNVPSHDLVVKCSEQTYDCPVCHDQGCFRCMDQWQLME